MSPSTYSEANGDYLGFDFKVHNVKEEAYPFSFVSDLSLWDIHRTQIPWLTLVHPEIARCPRSCLLSLL
jgi:putative alpha-1,2-mannosidase